MTIPDRKPVRILVVDDEPTITEFVTHSLSEEGYQPEAAASAEEALLLTEHKRYDLFILDIMLPGMNGYELCRRVRAISSAPVLFLSARDTEFDKVMGLEMGADDYLVKPFGVRELVARVRALLRRSEGSGGESRAKKGPLTAGGITLNVAEHTVEGPNGPFSLSPREFELLAYLMKADGRVVSRNDLLDGVWGWDPATEANAKSKTVESHIMRLRSKLKEAGLDPKLIVSVRNYGYRFSESA